MTRAPNLDCRFCGWYGWGGQDVLLRHVVSGQCVRRLIARTVEPWLKRLPSRPRPQLGEPIAPSPAPPERTWLEFTISMEQVAIDDPDPVDLPRDSAAHHGTPATFSIEPEPSVSGLRWRRASMAAFRQQVDREVQFRQRLGRDPAEPIDYEALRRQSPCYEQLVMYPGGGGGYHGFEQVRIKLRPRADNPDPPAADDGHAAREP